MSIGGGGNEGPPQFIDINHANFKTVQDVHNHFPHLSSPVIQQYHQHMQQFDRYQRQNPHTKYSDSNLHTHMHNHEL
jgi:hypothetical protein